MIAKLSIVSSLLTTLALPLANAVEYQTGHIPLTPEQQVEMDATILKVTQVLPNRLALQRVAGERGNTQRLTVPGMNMIPADDEADIIGVKGSQVAKVARNLSLTTAAMAYPKKVDNSTEAWFPKVGNQGGLGSCGPYCTTYYTMTSQVARLRGWNVKSDENPAHIFSPRFTYNLVNGGANSGSNVQVIFELLLQAGCATYADFPYDGMDFTSWPTTAPVWRNAINYRMAQVGMVGDIDTESGLAKAKQMLANGYIFNFSCNVLDWQYSQFSNDPATTADDELFARRVASQRRAVVSHCRKSDSPSGHGMTVVGYNDELWCDLNSNGIVDTGEKGALRIVNSWDTGWEDGGFTWVAYDSLKTVSSVPGAYSQEDRREAFWDRRLEWISARAAYTPSLVAEVTVTHPSRNQMSISVGRSSTSVTSPTTVKQFSRMDKVGGSWAFDGTTTPVEATFVRDCTDLLSSNGGNRWYVSLTDSGEPSAGTLTKVQFRDSSGVVTGSIGTNPSGVLPKTFDNSTVHAYADNLLSNNLAPVAKNQDIKVFPGIPTPLSLVAKDSPSNSRIYTIVSGPSHGNLTGTDNIRSYTANSNYQGVDFLTFKVTDGSLDSNLGMIVFRVGSAAQGLEAEFFNLDSGGTLPDLLGEIPSLKRIDSQINYAPESTFPSGYKSNFAIRHTGHVKIPTAGNYTFYLTSDDGSKLLINEVPVVLNDGSHGAVEKSGTVNLTAGYHALRVEYFQGYGGKELTMSWAGPGIPKAVVPANVLFYPLAPANSAPVVLPRTFVVSANSATSSAITLTATDTDLDTLAFTHTRPLHGSLFGDAPNLAYKPNPGYAGPDNFSYQANDGTENSNVETVSITVTNEAPTVVKAAAASTNPVTGLSTKLSVLGAIDTGEANLTYIWTAGGDPPAAVTFSANNSNSAKSSIATFSKVGTYNLVCAIRGNGDLVVNSSVTVVVTQTATANFVVKPSTQTLNITEKHQFKAGLADQFGELLPNQSMITWSLLDWTSGALSKTGLFSANLRTGGPYTIIATAGGKSATATVTVVEVNIPVGPAGYTWCGGEGTNFALYGLCDVVYGAEGQFSEKRNQTGMMSFTNDSFSYDPAPGEPKNGFFKRLSSDFDDWALASKVTGGVNGDSDNDGISNGVEFALQLNPGSADGASGTFRGNVLSFKKRATTSTSPSLTYRIEVSSDLGVTDPWTEQASTQNPDMIETTMPTSAKKMFARLRVIVKP